MKDLDYIELNLRYWPDASPAIAEDTFRKQFEKFLKSVRELHDVKAKADAVELLEKT